MQLSGKLSEPVKFSPNDRFTVISAIFFWLRCQLFSPIESPLNFRFHLLACALVFAAIAISMPDFACARSTLQVPKIAINSI